MKIKYAIIFILVFAYSMIGIDNISIIQITLSDANTGYLQGTYSAKESIVDWSNHMIYWSEQQTIFFY